MLPLFALNLSLVSAVPGALSGSTLKARAASISFARRVARSKRRSATLLVALALACASAPSAQTTNEWAWMGGKSTIRDITMPGAAGVYGTMGTPAAANLPGSRMQTASWTDKSGNLWLFGGLGYDIGDNKGALNDLWMYNPLTSKWTWIAGNNYAAPKGVYGTVGVAAAANTPGGRSYPVSWTDSSGNFWLFGGIGLDGSGSYGNLNDLWKFNPSTIKWTWMGGSSSVGSGCGGGTCGQDGVYGTLGKAAAANVPGGRNQAVGWTGKDGHFWLFGGFGHDASDNIAYLDDLWEFNPSTNQWTWMGGYNSVGTGGKHPGVYGAQGTAAAGNFPGTRGESSTWTDSNGNLWLLGGFGVDSTGTPGFLNDFWKFNPTTNQWTWMGGSSSGGGGNAQGGVYGTQGTPAAGNLPGGRYDALSWTDGAGHLWLFGGNAYDSAKFFSVMNDLWEFNPTANQWTWMGGSSTGNFDGGEPGVYGALGVAAPANIPGSRFSSACWTDSHGSLWLWGGNGFDINQTPGYPNDLWKYQLPAVVSLKATTTTLTSSQASSVYGEPVTLNARVASTGGTPPNGDSVTFSIGATALGTANLSGGLASLTTSALPGGTDSVTAVFAGDATYATSTSSALTQTVTKANSTTTLASTPNPSSFAELVTFTATVAGQFGGTATGTVTFKSGSTTLGSESLSGGKAAFPIAALPQGSDSVTAVYSGDANFNAGTSNTVKQVVAAPVTAGKEWTWISGGKTVPLVLPYYTGGLPGVYGTLGVPAPENTPGSHSNANSWIDPAGHLWLFGGEGLDASGHGYTGLNDLWQFNPATDEWTWVSGSSTVPCAANVCVVLGVYGKLGTPSAANVPGNRASSTSWSDAAGNLWLFGGWAQTSLSSGLVNFNDLWEFNTSTKQWTWEGGGSTVPPPNSDYYAGNSGVYGKLGTAAATNVPGGRQGAASWTDAAGNFWLFGGYGFDSKGIWGNLNDLWELNPSTRQWTWMGGSSTIPSLGGGNPGVYGTLGKAASTNIPGSRSGETSWTDKSGNLWLLGGYGLDANNKGGWLDDLWEFVAASKQWAWIAGSKSGSSSGIAGVYGSIGKAASANMPGSRENGANWTDSSGNFWLFGGSGADSAGNLGKLGDLWKYTPSTNQWTWVAGSSTVAKTTNNTGGPSGIYGTLGVPAAGNSPGGREYSVSWADGNGHLWLFGGNGIDSSGDYGQLNDLWRYQP